MFSNTVRVIRERDDAEMLASIGALRRAQTAFNETVRVLEEANRAADRAREAMEAARQEMDRAFCTMYGELEEA